VTVSRTVVAAVLLTLGTVIAAAPDDVRYFPASQVDASFGTGGTLLTLDNVRVMTGTRTGPGEAERHASDADIFHVLEGTATFVTGGTMLNEHGTAAGETRGSGIDGGDSRRLGPGDVITIAAGVPHWFKSVDGRFRYYIVKVHEG
jgi:quercetin dioxygenase-like cupin family protein